MRKWCGSLILISLPIFEFFAQAYSPSAIKNCGAGRKRFLPVFVTLSIVAIIGVSDGWALPTSPGEKSWNGSENSYIAQYDRSFYGNYLAGVGAARGNDFSAAARYFMLALEQADTDIELRDHAVLYGLASGQIEKSLDLAGPLIEQYPAHFFIRLALIARALKRQDFAEAERHLTFARQRPFDPAIPQIINGWLLAERGKFEKALQSLPLLDDDPHLLTHHALILTRAGRIEAALQMIEIFRSMSVGNDMLAIIHAELWAWGGHKEIAEELLNPDKRAAIYMSLVEAIRQDIAKEHYQLALQANQGVAVLFNARGEELAWESAPLGALIMLQLAHYLAPENPRFIYSLGNFFANNDQIANAEDQFRAIEGTSVLKRLSQTRLAEIWDSIGQQEAARAVFRQLALEQPNDLRIVNALGTSLRRSESFKLAEKVYDKAIMTISQPRPEHWWLYYDRGICRERQKKWPEAEADFQQSLALSPDQPFVLNYYGYSLVDQNVQIKKGMDMIRRALELRPDEWSIVDSLGWAHFRLGEYESAVRVLEEASLLAPDDSIVTDHLGDAYWMVGRRLEARYQWEQAKDFDPEDKLRVEILRKLKEGL